MATTHFARFTAALAAASLTAASFAAHAEDAEATRLQVSRKAERYSLATAGTEIRTGGAKIHVAAPLATTRSIVTDYGHYSQFPRFQKSRIVGKKDGKTDVYLQLGILHGAATVWALVRFEAPVKEGNGERIEGRMIEGNVDDLRATWHLQPTDDGNTILRSELLVVPKLKLPASVVTPELEYAGDQAATNARDRAEAKAKSAGAGATAQGELVIPRSRPCRAARLPVRAPSAGRAAGTVLAASSLFLLIACGKTPAAAPGGAATAAPSGSVAGDASSAAIAPSAIASAVASPLTRRPSGCWSNLAGVEPKERLAALALRCARDFRVLLPSVALKAGASLEIVLPANTCARVIVVGDQASARLDRADGTTFARAQGQADAVLPERGPFCTARGETVKLVLAGEAQAAVYASP